MLNAGELITNSALPTTAGCVDCPANANTGLATCKSKVMLGSKNDVPLTLNAGLLIERLNTPLGGTIVSALMLNIGLKIDTSALISG